MLLTAVHGVREALGFDDMTDINAAIEAALHAAEPQLAAQLGTPFERVTRQDIFWVPEPGYSQGAHSETQFRLRHGFLTTATVTVASASSMQYDTTLSTSLSLNLEAGLIVDLGTRFHEQYVKVAYTSGFEADPLDPRSYDLSQVPYWLQQAAHLKALRLLASNPAVTAAGIELDISVVDQQCAALVNSHLRYAPAALLPV